jgi:hypothetical protein
MRRGRVWITVTSVRAGRSGWEEEVKEMSKSGFLPLKWL